jgi:hypothetical protein
VDALKRGIESCKKNIETFEEAIEKERQTIKDYHNMIDVLERKEREAKLKKDFAEKHIFKVEESGDDSKK